MMLMLKGLISGDLRNVLRDPLLLFALFLPLALAGALKLLLPSLTAFLAPNYDIYPYLGLLTVFLLMLTSQLLGWLAGFMLLDERDDSILLAIAVTPLQKSGFLFYRLALPTLCTIPVAFMCIALSGLPAGPPLRFLLIVTLASLQAPLLATTLACFAKNKVEGLALTKLINLLLVVPMLMYFSPGTWNWILAFTPTFWITKLFSSQYLLPTQWASFYAVGVLVHILPLVWLIRKFDRSSD